ncbi:hypothetical protein AB0F68_16810 [Micromonospora sp. NPDC023966]|uniref:hypothetical protein n=1 Tax=Micromonospora sp. NPDC023966 TaxID=3154699 RepID=UPI0033F7789D
MAETSTDAPVSEPEDSGVRKLADSSGVSESFRFTTAQMSPALKALAEVGRVSESFRFTTAQTFPALKALAEVGRASLKQIDSGVWDQLAAGADLFASVGIADVLREEAPRLVGDPATWLAEAEEAAQAGDERAGNVLLLVRYLFECFLLLAQRLNPSAKTIEKVGALLALSVFMTVVVGTTYANSPKTLEKWNTCLGTPLGILGLYLAISGSGGKRPRRHKPSLNRRGNSKPRTQVLRRFRH